MTTVDCPVCHGVGETGMQEERETGAWAGRTCGMCEGAGFGVLVDGYFMPVSVVTA